MLSVVDKNGEILAKFAKREDAEDWARSRGMAVMAGDTVLSDHSACPRCNAVPGTCIHTDPEYCEHGLLRTQWCVHCDWGCTPEERSDQVARDEAMCRYVEDYRAEFGDDAVLFDPFAGELGD